MKPAMTPCLVLARHRLLGRRLGRGTLDESESSLGSGQTPKRGQEKMSNGAGSPSWPSTGLTLIQLMASHRNTSRIVRLHA